MIASRPWRRVLLLLVISFGWIACVGEDSGPAGPNGGGDAGGAEVGVDALGPDSSKGALCVFGTSRFGDGCVFGK